MWQKMGRSNWWESTQQGTTYKIQSIDRKIKRTIYNDASQYWEKGCLGKYEYCSVVLKWAERWWQKEGSGVSRSISILTLWRKEREYQGKRNAQIAKFWIVKTKLPTEKWAWQIPCLHKRWWMWSNSKFDR